MKVSKWGNSLAIRFPKEIVDILRLKEGDDIEITTGDALAVKRKPLPRDVLARLRKYRGMMPEGWKFDRDEANER